MNVTPLEAVRSLRMVQERLSEAEFTWQDLPLDSETIRNYVAEQMETAEKYLREAERVMNRVCKLDKKAA